MAFYFIILILLLIIINSINEILSVDLCEKNGKLRPTFTEIFGQKWGNEKLEYENENENETDNNGNYHQSDQNELNSTGNDQNDQLDDQEKRKIIHKFHAIKEGIKKKGKRNLARNIRNKIEQKIAKKLGISRSKIYKWKKELGFVYENNFYNQKKAEFIERINEFKRMSKNGKQKQFMKELGISHDTLIKWKKEFGIKLSKKGIRHSTEEKMSKMNDYYKMNNENPTLTFKEIASLLKISKNTLIKWEKEKKLVNCS